MLRRSMLSFVAMIPVVALVDCTGTQGAVTLEQAKAYLTDGVNATLAAAQAYLVSTPPPTAQVAATVKDLMVKLEAASAALEGVVSVVDWKAGALEALTVLQQLSPMVAPFLGPAGPFLPVAIAVVEAFVQSLPPPPNAPVVPPAALHAKAMQYHRR
jgi:hypothetical protein